ncbi:MAG: lamin tail domain-containing protein, partial [Bacteroidota bacterium]
NLDDEVRLFVHQNAGGQLVLNDHLNIQSSGYQGRYFGNMTIHLEAQPYFGHQFDYWLLMDGTKQRNPHIEIALQGKNQQVEAVFKSASHPLEGQIVINEIACNNPPSGDWLELYNQSGTSIHLDGWYIKDAEQSWQLPNFELASDGFVVLCKDSLAFREVFGPTIPIIGNLPFGLSRSKERIELYTSYRAPIDSLTYQFNAPDSDFVYLLDHPALNNAQSNNWQLSAGTGSPGQHNPPYLQQKEAQRTKVFYAGIGGAACMLLLALSAFTRKKRPTD